MSKRKIPRLALVTLALGGACRNGNGDGEGNPDARDALRAGNQDVSQERLDTVVAAICEQYNECDQSSFRENYASVQECTAAMMGYFDVESDTCKDAMLDFYSCYTKLSCEQLDDDDGDQCGTLEQRAEHCDFDESGDDENGDDYDYDDDYSYD